MLRPPGGWYLVTAGPADSCSAERRRMRGTAGELCTNTGPTATGRGSRWVRGGGGGSQQGHMEELASQADLEGQWYMAGRDEGKASRAEKPRWGGAGPSAKDRHVLATGGGTMSPAAGLAAAT